MNLNTSFLTHSQTKALSKLTQMLNGTEINELPLDYIGTQYFSDYYSLITVLGSGSFAVVLEVREKSTKECYAMKVGLEVNLVNRQN